MSILNQSIMPQAQPLFPSKGANPQDTFQNLPTDHLFHRSVSLKSSSSQCNLLKKTTLTTSSTGGSAHREESSSKNSELGNKSHGHNSILESISDRVLKLPQLFKNESTFNLLSHLATLVDHNAETTTDMEIKPFNKSFTSSFTENKKIDLVKDTMGQEDFIYTNPNETPLLVVISSAVKLEGKQLDQIARKMETLTGSSNLRLENTVDPSLIAGFVIMYEKDAPRVIDLSVKAQLADLVATVESTDKRISNQSQVGLF